MTFKYSILIIAAYIYIDIFCVGALPVRLERQTSGNGEEVLNSMMKSALVTLRDVANYGLPKDASHFHDTCHLLKELTRMNDSNLQECQENVNVSNGNLHTIKSVICGLLNKSSEWTLLEVDGSCSDSTLDLFCTKTMLAYDIDSAQQFLNVRPDVCMWVDELSEVSQEIKDSIYGKLLC